MIAAFLALASLLGLGQATVSRGDDSQFSELNHFVSRVGENPEGFVREAIPVETRRQYKILRIGKSLGSGGTGAVFSAEVLLPDGKIQKVALKLIPRNYLELSLQFLKGATILAPIMSSGETRGIQKEQLALTVALKDGHAVRQFDAVMSPIVDGSVTTKLSELGLSGSRARLQRRLPLVSKFLDDLSYGLQELSRHGLVHNDIKPPNIFFVTQPGFDWRKPDPKKIEFKLADFDFAARVGTGANASTPSFSPPESFFGSKGIATTARDVYSLADSLYSVMFGRLPLDDYLDAMHEPKAKDVRERQRLWIYERKDRYDAYLEWVDRKLNSLIKPSLDTRSKLELERIRSFIRQGLSFDPSQRSGAISVGLESSLCSQWFSLLKKTAF